MIAFTHFQHSIQNTPALAKLHHGNYQNLQGYQVQAVHAMQDQAVKQQKMVCHSEKTDDARIRDRERKRNRNKQQKKKNENPHKGCPTGDSDHLIDFIA